MSALWPHQIAAVEAIDQALETHRSTLVVAATGTGKTTTGAEACRRRRHLGRLLWLAHREELITQPAGRIRSHAGLAVGIEMAGQRAGNLEGLDVVCATVQTLGSAKRRAAFAPDAFATIIYDEAHHAVCRSGRAILDHFPAAKVIGLTATPDRGDGVAMARVFETTAHVYEIRQAIRDGFLCRIRQRAIEVEGFDLSEVRTTAGDLNEGDLERLLLDPDLLQRISAAIVDAAGARPTIVFAVTVAHAHALAATLNGFEPESARACDGGTEGELRRQTLDDFKAGAFKRLVNCALWTEGFDEPSIACVAVVRPTKSRAFYAQMIGRGLRVAGAHKPDCLILDFQGNAGRHSLVCPIDVLGGADVDPAVKKKAAAAMAERPDLDLLTALENATRELAQERRAKLLALSNHRAVEIDPFDLVEVALGGVVAIDGASIEEDLQYIADHARGLSVERLKPAAVATIASTLRAREAAGRATWAQVRCLMRAGLPSDVDRATAARAIAALSANGWQATEALRQRLSPAASVAGNA